MSYLSRVQYTGSGAVALYSIPFAYISKAYIEVRVAGVLLVEGVGFTWQSATSILLSAGNLGAGIVLDIRRATPKTSKLVDFQDGSVLTEADLDLANDQVFQMSQEVSDDMLDRLSREPDGSISGHGLRITDVADPVTDQDVVTKGWATNSVTTQIGEVAAAAADASAAAAAATAAAASLNVSLLAPKTGVGATGTWPINVTGNAATVSAIPDGAVSTAAKLGANVVGVAKMAREGTAGQVLFSGGPSADPSWGTAPSAPVTSVGGNVGTVSNAQIAAAAAAGWGATPSFPGHTHSYAGMNAIVSISNADTGSPHTCIRADGSPTYFTTTTAVAGG